MIIQDRIFTTGLGRIVLPDPNKDYIRGCDYPSANQPCTFLREIPQVVGQVDLAESGTEKPRPGWVAPVIELFERNNAIGPGAAGRVLWKELEDAHQGANDGVRWTANTIAMALRRYVATVESTFPTDSTKGYRLTR